MPETTQTSVPSRGRPRTFNREEALIRALTIFWRRGYEPTSIDELCSAMNIRPPSLYAAFGNKAKLFLEAVDYYEKTYWDDAWARMLREDDVYIAIDNFFKESAAILTSQAVPCGCLVVLAAVNVSPESQDVFDAVKVLREEGRSHFLTRLKRGVDDGQLTDNADVEGIAMTLNTLLEGMSIPALDGIPAEALVRIAANAAKLLPVQSAEAK